MQETISHREKVDSNSADKTVETGWTQAVDVSHLALFALSALLLAIILYREVRTDWDNLYFGIVGFLLLVAGTLFLRRKEVAAHQKMDAALRHNEERFRLVAQATNDALYDWDLITDAAWRGEGYYRLWGITDAMMNERDWWLKRLHPDDQEKIVAALHALHEGHIDIWMENYRLRLENGTYANLVDRGYIMRNAAGAPIRVIGALTDVTERSRAEEALHRRDTLLEALARIGSQLLRSADLNHEFENVLAILGQAANTSRVYLFESHLNADGVVQASQRYEWRAPGIASKPQQSADLTQTYDVLKTWNDTLQDNQVVYGLRRDLPEKIREILDPDILSILSVPVFCGEKFWGLLGFDECRSERAWLPVEIEAMRGAASTFGSALLRQETETSEREQRILAQALSDTAAALTSTLEPEVVMARILENLDNVVPHGAANIMLIEGDTARTTFSRGYEGEHTFRVTPFALETPNLRHMIESQGPIVISDTMSDPRWAKFPDTAWILSYAGAPLRVHGVIIGFLNLDSAIPGFFAAFHAERLLAFADQAAVALENARLYVRLRERATTLEERVGERTHALQVAADVSKQITTVLELDSLLPQLVERLLEEFGLDGVSIFLVDQASKSLRYKVGKKTPVAPDENGTRVHTRPLSDVNPVSTDPNILAGRADLSLPLAIGDELLGVLDLHAGPERRFTAANVRILTNLAEQISIAVRNAQLFADVQNARRESDILYRVSRSVNASTSYTGILQALLDELGTVDFSIALTIFQNFDLVRAVYTDVVAVALAGQTQAQAFNQRVPLYAMRDDPHTSLSIEDMDDAAQVDPSDARLYQGWGVQALLTANIELGNRAIGSFVFLSDKPRKFSDFERRLIRGMADLAAGAIERSRLFAEAEAAQKAAEEANRVKSQFLANMSHELRTPLNAVINFTVFVADGVFGDVNSDQAEALQQAISGARHLLSLINDILDLTKIEVGLMDLFIQKVDVNEALATTVSVAKGLVKDKPLTLVTDIDPTLPPTFGDKRRIRQIFLNLVSNAVKFTNNGTITISAHSEANGIHVAVADTGIGIAPEDQTLVFESFKQASNDVTEAVGTGLGLPISRFFAEAHGGKMWLDSEVGKGSTFHVLLPIRTEEEANRANMLM